MHHLKHMEIKPYELSLAHKTRLVFSETSERTDSENVKMAGCIQMWRGEEVLTQTMRPSCRPTALWCAGKDRFICCVTNPETKLNLPKS